MTRRELLVASVAPLIRSRRRVCIFLRGGNDGYNTAVRYADYDAYRRARGELALAEKSLVRIGEYGLHPALAPLRDFPIAVIENVVSSPLTHHRAYEDWRSAIPHETIVLTGFDTHGAQLEMQSRALANFARIACDLASQGAVVYTASEFGRTLAPNSTSGTDHASINRHLIVDIAAHRTSSKMSMEEYLRFCATL